MRTFTLATLMSAVLSLKMRACEDTNNNGICDEDEELAQQECWDGEGNWVCEGDAPDLAQEEEEVECAEGEECLAQTTDVSVTSCSGSDCTSVDLA